MFFATRSRVSLIMGLIRQVCLNISAIELEKTLYLTLIKLDHLHFFSNPNHIDAERL